MDAVDVTQKIHAMLVEQLGVSANQLTRDASLIGDLHAEELDLLDLEISIETAFNIQDLHRLNEPFSTTVGELIDRVVAAVAQR